MLATTSLDILSLLSLLTKRVETFLSNLDHVSVIAPLNYFTVIILKTYSFNPAYESWVMLTVKYTHDSGGRARCYNVHSRS